MPQRRVVAGLATNLGAAAPGLPALAEVGCGCRGTAITQQRVAIGRAWGCACRRVGGWVPCWIISPRNSRAGAGLTSRHGRMAVAGRQRDRGPVWATGLWQAFCTCGVGCWGRRCGPGFWLVSRSPHISPALGARGWISPGSAAGGTATLACWFARPLAKAPSKVGCVGSSDSRLGLAVGGGRLLVQTERPVGVLAPCLWAVSRACGNGGGAEVLVALAPCWGLLPWLATTGLHHRRHNRAVLEAAPGGRSRSFAAGGLL